VFVVPLQQLPKPKKKYTFKHPWKLLGSLHEWDLQQYGGNNVLVAIYKPSESPDTHTFEDSAVTHNP
jgi:hypothetical protein